MPYLVDIMDCRVSNHEPVGTDRQSKRRQQGKLRVQVDANKKYDAWSLYPIQLNRDEIVTSRRNTLRPLVMAACNSFAYRSAGAIQLRGPQNPDRKVAALPV